MSAKRFANVKFNCALRAPPPPFSMGFLCVVAVASSCRAQNDNRTPSIVQASARAQALYKSIIRNVNSDSSQTRTQHSYANGAFASEPTHWPNWTITNNLTVCSSLTLFFSFSLIFIFNSFARIPLVQSHRRSCRRRPHRHISIRK